MAERDEQAVLFANEAFYRAFCDRDMAAMRALWARRGPVACIHPGWGPLTGREVVLESWNGLLAKPESPAILCHEARAILFGDFALVICFEELGGQFLIATNTFMREDGDWKMVMHQAGPTNETPRRAPPRSGPMH